PLADAGDDRLLGRPADKALDVRAHRHPGLDLELDAILRYRVNRLPAHLPTGHVDHLRIDARLYRLEDVTAGEVDGGRVRPGQVDPRLVGGDHGVDDAHEVS